MEAYRCILLEPPLMGKGRDRGAREPIKPITPTFVLPRQGEGIRALPPVGFFVSRPIVQPRTNFSKEDAKSPARPSRNKTRNISRKGAKHVLSNVEGAAMKIKLPNLAFLASWREQIPVLGNHGPPESLRKPRKLSTIVIRSL
jgi:hypothetical protein